MQETKSEEGQSDETKKEDCCCDRFWCDCIPKSRIIYFLILGVILGMMVKSYALERITIGFEDYKASSLKGDFELPGKIQVEEEQGENEEENVEAVEAGVEEK
jgi:hypothetical protein